MKKSVLALISVACLALSACASSESDADATNSDCDVVFGANTELTGSLQQYGLGAKQGFAAAVEHLNEGGLEVADSNCAVSSKISDNRSDPSTVTSAAQEVLDSGAVMALGPDLSAQAAYGIWKDKLITWAVDFELTSELKADPEAHPTLFDPLPFFDDLYVASLKQMVKADPTVKRVAILSPSNEEGQASASYWEQALESVGLDVVSNIAFPDGATDYSTFLTTIKGENPDLLIPLQSADQAEAIMRQAIQLDVTTKFLNNQLDPNTVVDDDALKDAHVFIPNYGPFYSERSSVPGDDAEAVFGDEPIPASPTASIVVYYSALATAEAMKAAGTTTDVSKISAAMSGLKIDGPFGTCTMGEDHSLACRTDLVTVEDGGISIDSFADPEATELLGRYTCSPECTKE